MELYQVKMSPAEFNEYLHRTVGYRKLEPLLERYSQEELASLAQKMDEDLAWLREKESVFPEDWERFIDAVRNMVSD